MQGFKGFQGEGLRVQGLAWCGLGFRVTESPKSAPLRGEGSKDPVCS